MKAALKKLAQAGSLVAVLPAWLVFLLQARLSGPDRAVSGWSEAFSLLPGTAGIYLRQAFFRLTLRSCADNVWIGFGTVFSHAEAALGQSVYLGHYCSIGNVTIEDDVLIASHVSIMNGCQQHSIEQLDIPIREQPGVFVPITIGRDSWIGERALVAADVGRHCVIGAGAVVLSAVPDYAVAVGVPARVIRDRRVAAPPATPQPDASVTTESASR